jgi:uncharacterized protein (DUF2267 family)
MATGVFNRTVQQAHEWLHELRRTLGLNDEGKAFRVLRPVLHVLRDRLTVTEAVQLGAQLPVLVRGYYYEGWRPSGKPVHDRHLDEFLGHVQESLGKDDTLDSEEAVRAVFDLLSRRLSRGEIDDIWHSLPPEIRSLWSGRASVPR